MKPISQYPKAVCIQVISISPLSVCYISTGLRFGSVILDSNCAGLVSEDVLVEESSMPSIDSNWFVDDLLSIDGGSYNPIDNQWTPIRKAIQNPIFHFEVTLLGESCIDTVFIKLDIPVMAAAYDSNN